MRYVLPFVPLLFVAGLVWSVWWRVRVVRGARRLSRDVSSMARSLRQR